MKRFFKILAAAWLTGAVMGAGCLCGSVATGMLIPSNSNDYEFVQSQIAEIQETLETMDREAAYDLIMAMGSEE